MDSSLGPRALTSCLLLLRGPGGRTVQDGKRQRINSQRPQACVCVLCRLHMHVCVFQCVVCAIKNLTKVLIIKLNIAASSDADSSKDCEPGKNVYSAQFVTVYKNPCCRLTNGIFNLKCNTVKIHKGL